MKPIELLLVEDSLTDAELIQSAFEENRFALNLRHVLDGVEALDYLRQRPPYQERARPDLMLLDLNLPRKDGREVLAEIKADDELRCMPVIILTTSAAEADLEAAYHHHANAFLTKPVDFEAFMNVIRQVGEFWLSAARLPHRC
jgi:CheY-like chemotaxis protein